MANRSRFPRSAVRGPRRETEWLFIDFISSTTGGVGGTLLASLDAAALAIRPFTVIRTHLELYFSSDQEIASEQQAGALGMAVVSDQASGIGVTAVPTPVIDQGSDLWFVYQVLFNAFQFSSAVGTQKEGTRYTVDSKAMRKVNADQDIVLCMGLSAIGSGFNLMVAGRFLVKLH